MSRLTREEKEAVLITELRDDPLTRGYSGMTNTQVKDSLLDTKDRTISGGASVTSAEFLDNVSKATYNALTAEKKSEFWDILSLQSIRLDKLEGQLLEDMLGANTSDALRTAKQISRAEELGLDDFPTEGRISQARR